MEMILMTITVKHSKTSLLAGNVFPMLGKIQPVTPSRQLSMNVGYSSGVTKSLISKKLVAHINVF